MGQFKNRYGRNAPAIGSAEQKQLAASSVCVIGCGGLGGGVIENLTRLGVGRITAVDCDSFDESNLNRQVLSNENNLEHSKAVEARLQMKQINSEIEVFSIQALFSEENGEDIVRGHTAAVDALDNIRSRMVLEKVCEKENIPLVHGAVDGWQGQVAVVMPGDRSLHSIYNVDWDEDSPEEEGERHELRPSGTPSFTPAVVAGIQTAETLKLILRREGNLRGKMLILNLETNEYEIVEL